MTNEEFEKLCEEFLAQGLTEEDILGAILNMFEEGKIDLDTMKKLAGARGYELSEEFLKKVGDAGEGTINDMPEGGEESPAEGEEVAADNGEEYSAEEIEDAQEFDEGEGEEEESEESEEEEEDEEKSEESESEDDEDEKKKAMKEFGL